MFTKLTVPLSILRKLNIRVIIYKRMIRIIIKDSTLLQGKTFLEVLMVKDTDIVLLEHLGFVINLSKSVIIPTYKIQFSCLIIDSVHLTLPLTPKKFKVIA